MAVIKETKEGIISELYDDDAGTVRENGTEVDYDFYHPGAKLEFIVGKGVTYLQITTPGGKVIIRDIKKEQG
jgi:hypothetical protein